MTLKRFLLVTVFLMLLGQVAYAKKDNQIYLSLRVKESVGKTDLLQSMILWPDSTGTKNDTLRPSGARYKNGEMIKMSTFYFPVPRKDSTYVFDVICEGYTPYTMVYDVRKVGKRESYREIPTLYLKKAPRQLDAVTVTTSKIKFYNKGDTVVFNADAFQLAEGSMLDGLIAQLPGVELTDDGQIKVNGEFVESLLLNGKQFLDGDNKLMLENIAAYTVKNVEVYQGQTREEKWANDKNQKKHLTMDVKLKKEYQHGWIINAQGGYGTKERYTGRVFASWFSPTTTIALMGNVNNLNDNREPGKNDSWTPDMMPSGTKEYRMGALNYDYESPESDRTANGKFSFKETVNRNRTTTARTNFLSGGDTYDNSFSNSFSRDTRYDTSHRLGLMKDRYYASLYLTGRYRDVKNSSDAVSATFDTEQQDITMQAIEAMYSDGSPINLGSVINRSITRTDGSRKEFSGQAYPSFSWKLPGTNDHLMFWLGFDYKSLKEERWKDYTINYGADPRPASRLRQYFDNTPNYTFVQSSEVSYFFNIRDFHIGLRYEYEFTDKVQDSYMYALDRLSDMGVYGTLPVGYLDVLDPSNSYTSRQIDNKHSIVPYVQYYSHYENGNWLMVMLNPNLSLLHTHFDYMREGRTQLVKRNYFLFYMSGWSGKIRFGLGKVGEGRSQRNRNQFEYTFNMTPHTPNPVDMVDVTNSSDPLNIHTGNPDLKLQYNIGSDIRWTYTPGSLHLNNTLSLNYSVTHNALTNGYVYNTETGVREYKMYNTDGNSQYGMSNVLSYQFGSKSQFSLSSNTDLNRYTYGDMIGVNQSVPTLSKVASLNFNEKLTLSWQLGKQMLQLRGSYTNRHTTSSRTDFNTIDANHYNIGVTGQFRLPAGFGINTDFTVYTRRGYGVKELDTSDAIWNMRLTWSPVRNKRWVFMIDGFDMLHQLSNVNYAVNAAGRTVSYSNALPRYMLFSVQYRLNIQPKKKQ